MKLACLGLAPLCFSLLVASSVEAAGDVYGELRMASPMGSGTTKFWAGKLGTRTEVNLGEVGGHAGASPMSASAHMVMLIKADNREVVYRLDDEAKTYSEMDMSKVGRGQARPHHYHVKMLGNETVNGHSCKHVLVTSDEQDRQTELWTNRTLFDYDTFDRMSQRHDEDLTSALKAASADGFVVKMVVRKGADASQPEMTMDLVKLEHRAAPAGTFEIPSDYTKSTTGPGPSAAAAMSNLPPDVRAKIEERMKNMTPEQREAMQRAMAGQYGAQPAAKPADSGDGK